MSGCKFPLVCLAAIGCLLFAACMLALAGTARAQAPVPATVEPDVLVTGQDAGQVPGQGAGQGAVSTTVPGTVVTNANLRGGPGTNYPIVGKAAAGSTVNVVEATADRTWYYLDNGSWIAAFLVKLSASPGPGETWSVAPGQPAGIFTAAVTTIVTTTVTTIDASGTTIITTTTSTTLPPNVTAPVVTAPGGTIPVAAAPLQAAPLVTVPVVALGPITPSLVISQLLPSDVQSATLVSVSEGDVIEVDINGVRESVRYLGVDTPDAGQLGFATATAANQTLVQGQELLLQREQTDRDAQNRLLRHVFTVDRSVSDAFNGGYAGIYVNGQLAADGWAMPYSSAPDVSRQPELERWALDASRAPRGFWGGNGGADNAVFGVTRMIAPLFSGPGADNGADAVLGVDTLLNVIGRSPDGAWLQVRTPRRDEGWVFASQISVTGPISKLPVTANASGPTPVPQGGQAAAVGANPAQPGQPGVPTPFPGQPAAATPFPGQPGFPTPLPGQQPVPGQPIPGQPVPSYFGPTVIITANLRSGPGTIYPVVGTALASAPITITARNADTTWLQTDNNTWIATGLVTGVTANTLPQFNAPPTPEATMPPEPTAVLVVPPGVTAPTPTITPTAPPTATPLGNPTPTFTPMPPTPLVRLIALDRGNEWAILYNDGTGTQDLTGWVLVSENGDQRCELKGTLAPRESLRVWAQVGPDGFSCGFPQPIWENSGPDAAILLNAYGDEVSRIQ
jgi:hypothetical protein